MGAAVSPAPLPLFHEGMAYWEQLNKECKLHLNAINTVAIDCGLPADHLIEWAPGRNIGMIRQRYPSTEVTVELSFEHWGPTVTVAIRDRQDEELRFYPEELEVPLGKDEDGMVAILGEGKSLSPSEFACYLAQNFRRCFPGISLPC